MKNMIEAIVFDFDGLILDTETPDYLSWQKMYAKFGVELPLDVWHSNIGSANLFNPYLYLEEVLGRPIDRQAVHDQRKVWDNEFLAAQTILPGVEAVLADARQMGLKIGLASSSDHGWVDSFLAKLGLTDWFAVVRCSDDVDGRAKPDPAVYQSALAGLGVAPQQAMALEDSPNGLAAAKKAGMFCTAVPNQMTRPLNFDQADLVLESLAQMPLAQMIVEVVKMGKANGAKQGDCFSNADRIREFHTAMGAAVPTRPILPDAAILALRQTLIREEYDEVTAVFQQLINGQSNDITPLIHELTDLLYVVYGAIEACGVDPDPVFAEVHRANMEKMDGPRRADGKLLKPPGWQPADVRGVIEQQQDEKAEG